MICDAVIPFSACVFLLALVSGCSAPPMYEDSSSLEITPGLGIPHVLEIGMPVSEVRKSTRDLVLLAEGRAMVPSLGAFIRVDAKDAVADILFVTDFANHAESSPTRSASPFTGHLVPGPVFTQGQPVRCRDVVAAWGRPLHVIDLSATVSSSSREESLQHLRNCIGRGESVHLTEGDSGTVFYPDRGVTFKLHKNTVTGVYLAPRPEHSPGPTSD